MEKGDIYKSVKYGELEVLKVHSSSKVTVRFKDTDYTSNFRASDIRVGNVKDLRAKTIYGVGIIYDAKLKKDNPVAYKTWNQMLKRGYDKVWKVDNPTYKNVTVNEKWHTFPNFLKWYLSQPRVDGYILDKDMYNQTNSMYSSKTSFMVPRNLNSFFSVNTKDKGVALGVHKVRSNKFVVKVNGYGNNGYVGTFKNIKSAKREYFYVKAKLGLEMLDSIPKKELSMKLRKKLSRRWNSIIKRGTK